MKIVNKKQLNMLEVGAKLYHVNPFASSIQQEVKIEEFIYLGHFEVDIGNKAFPYITTKIKVVAMSYGNKMIVHEVFLSDKTSRKLLTTSEKQALKYLRDVHNNVYKDEVLKHHHECMFGWY